MDESRQDLQHHINSLAVSHPALDSADQYTSQGPTFVAHHLQVVDGEVYVARCKRRKHGFQ
jgi:hypothetical protein